jgi:hypothetical protein
MNRLLVVLCFALLVGGCATRSQPAASALQARVSALQEQNTKKTEEIGKLHTEIAELNQEILDLELLNMDLVIRGFSQDTPPFDFSYMTEICPDGSIPIQFYEPVRQLDIVHKPGPGFR